MATPQRKPDPSLIEQLFQDPYGFSFFQAVNLLEKANPGKFPLGKALSPEEEPVRFSAKGGLSFPASEISALEQGEENGVAAMEVAFLGLIGPSGVLPHWYTELVEERLRKKDSALKDFLDLFHHRLVSLFYLAWKKYRFPVQFQAGAKDRLSRDLLSLSGLGTAGLTDRIGLPGESLNYFGGYFSRPVASAVAIQSAVEYFADVRAEVEQFIERTLPLEPEDRSRLGMANANLGENTVVGSQVWECQSKFRVVLGPLTYKEFQTFLPCGRMLRPIFALVKYMVGMEFEFEIRLVLKRQEMPLCTLGGRKSDAPRLGWSTWVRHADFYPDADPFITFRESDLT